MARPCNPCAYLAPHPFPSLPIPRFLFSPTGQAVHFLALAAEAAIKLAAYERAQEILKQALDLDIDAVPCLTLVKIYRMMGETAFDLSDEVGRSDFVCVCVCVFFFGGGVVR